MTTSPRLLTRRIAARRCSRRDDVNIRAFHPTHTQWPGPARTWELGPLNPGVSWKAAAAAVGRSLTGLNVELSHDPSASPPRA